MAIEWQEELATGIEHVDSQHKGIFARFESFSTACYAGYATEDLIKLMDFLKDYTHNHFCDEEKSMQGVEYPDLCIQQENHKNVFR